MSKYLFPLLTTEINMLKYKHKQDRWLTIENAACTKNADAGDTFLTNPSMGAEKKGAIFKSSHEIFIMTLQGMERYSYQRFNLSPFPTQFCIISIASPPSRIKTAAQTSQQQIHTLLGCETSSWAQAGSGVSSGTICYSRWKRFPSKSWEGWLHAKQSQDGPAG